MQSSFNLLDRPWIEVVGLDGRVRLASINEVFAEAADLRCLGGDLPTQTFAILRLLLAILHRSLNGPADRRAWQVLWQSTTLPVADIESYLDTHRDRFDLLHPVTPFYQVAELRTGSGDVTGLDRIVADVPNGSLYLTNRLGPGLARISPAEAARWLVHCHAFDVSGIKTGAVGDPRAKNGKVYPLGVGTCGSYGGVFIEGRNLRETLLFNLIPYDNSVQLDNPNDSPGDLPAWERPPSSVTDDEPTRGRLAVLTWQSRRVRLIGDDDGITHALVSYGDQLVTDDGFHVEPMTGWRRSPAREKAQKRTVYAPRSHDPNKALWRGLDALLPRRREGSGGEAPAAQPPPVTEWMAELASTDIVSRELPIWTHAVGVAYGTQNAVVDQVYDDRLALPIEVFAVSDELRTTVVGAATDAEAVARAVGKLGENIARASGGSGDVLRASADRAEADALSRLDLEFRDWLAGVGKLQRAEAREIWQRRARRVAVELGGRLVDAAGPTAWIGRNIEKDVFLTTGLAEVWFRAALKKALPLAAPEPHEVASQQEVMA